ncbi:MAG: LapA family protein [Gammaproteobacteria bacterium]
MSRIITVITLLFVIIAGLALYIRNNQPVVLNYYLGEIEVSLFLLAVGGVFIGAVLGMLAALPLMISLKRKNAKLARQIKKNEKEQGELKTAPARDSE